MFLLINLHILKRHSDLQPLKFIKKNKCNFTNTVLQFIIYTCALQLQITVDLQSKTFSHRYLELKNIVFDFITK